ncbi:putative ribosomal protein L13 [Lyophyllum shimeji]|uniref:60S ribosomal protein L13 n=1 Tax=Lyophyllum shimeji TaxID=47721 RepID=A0A9P3UM92_LYOSH|nr:putative ribosomal protein L13 [Lyophyllum shimeji]
MEFGRAGSGSGIKKPWLGRQGSVSSTPHDAAQKDSQIMDVENGRAHLEVNRQGPRQRPQDQPEDMGFAHNNVLHNNHFRKDWQRRVRTWFDQPGRKLRRRNARKAKAARLGIRPVAPLRPAVRGQTVRYNRKIREGRGFTLLELKEAGIGRKEARGIGIAVDHRRTNLSEEGKKVNVERLKEYKSRLIVFPRKAGKPKQGDSSAEELKAPITRQPLPLPSVDVPEPPRKITPEERDFQAYRTLRIARANARHEGARKARAAKKEEEEAAKKK